MIAKRAFDIATSLTALIVLAPLFVVTAVAIRLDSSGPIFFRQERVGQNGRHFRIRKFRSMRAAPVGGAREITVGQDPRITAVGHFIRKTKIDELPQLIDVLVGDMSIVGPRPEVPRYVELYPAQVRSHVLSVRPGITDRASVIFRNESDLLAQAADPEQFYVDEILPRKLDIYADYASRVSLSEDISIIWSTFKSLFVSGPSKLPD